VLIISIPSSKGLPGGQVVAVVAWGHWGPRFRPLCSLPYPKKGDQLCVLQRAH